MSKLLVNEYNLYRKNIEHLNKLESNISNLEREIANIDIYNIPKELIESNMDKYDMAFIILSGLIGGTFSSSSKIEEFMADIHNGAANKSNFIEKILSHTGDHMDRVGDKFKTRTGVNPEVPFHRVFFGHDPFSMSGDNPFSLLAGQHGIIKGPIKVVRHLIADTFSKQGLPLPGHSFLDFQGPNGKTANYLVELTKKIAKGSDIKPGKAFNHLFTLRMQDIISQGLTWGLCEGYIRSRGIEDEIRKSQIKISSYSISFFTNIYTGMIKTGGVPYINWPTMAMISRELFLFYKGNLSELKKLEQITDQIIAENIKLENNILKTGESIKTYKCSDEYIEDFENQIDKFGDLTSIFEE